MKAARRAPEASAEHEFEAAYGLPEPLPPGERLLWQGQPLTGLVARRVFHLQWVAAYFALMLAWRIAVLTRDGLPLADTLRGSLVLLALAAFALGLLLYLAHLTARTTVYTLTDRRVVMRIGIVLTVTYNLPLRCIDAAHLLPLGGGRGEIALQLQADTHIAYLHLWPHARAWHLRSPQPLLRGLADADAVAKRLGEAWSVANAQAARAASPATPSGPQGLPGLSPARSAS